MVEQYLVHPPEGEAPSVGELTSACRRKSVAVSTRTFRLLYWIRIEARVRLFLGFLERQTLHRHVGTGTP